MKQATTCLLTQSEKTWLRCCFCASIKKNDLNGFQIYLIRNAFSFDEQCFPGTVENPKTKPN